MTASAVPPQVIVSAMSRAISESLPHRTHPNPRVGAVVIGPDRAILAVGSHHGPGTPHAEVDALSRLDDKPPPGSVMVVTLEPCNHYGRTPPCTEAIIAAGVDRVVVGALDPDPRVSGGGVERLRAAGVEVQTGTLAFQVEAADPAYFHHRRTGRAHVTIKSASTLDGQTAAADGTSQWITSEEARADSHLLRASMDAVLVGAGTLRADDPTLTVRTDDPPRHQPVGVVIAGTGELPVRARLWERPDTLVISTTPRDLGVEVVQVSAGDDGLPDPVAVATILGDRGLLAVMLEGGARLAASFWKAGVVDAGVSYLAARLAGGTGASVFGGTWATLADSVPVVITATRGVGPDLRVDWKPSGDPVRM